MHLSAGDSICVIIKGTDIMLAKSISGILSARNRTRGIVKEIIRGDVLSKVLIESQGDVLHAIITNASLDEMKINSGDEITAIVKSTELILSKEF
jgi:molybdate transport system regulatory protein